MESATAAGGVEKNMQAFRSVWRRRGRDGGGIGLGCVSYSGREFEKSSLNTALLLLRGPHLPTLFSSFLVFWNDRLATTSLRIT